MTDLLLALVRMRPLIERLEHDMAAPSGVTAAGWQVASALGTEAATVPQIADRLGRRRQTVQTAVDDLVHTGHAEKRDNPAHARSPLIALTPIGIDAFWNIVDRQIEFVNEVGHTFSPRNLQTAVTAITTLEELLKASPAQSS
ncbi:MAG: MarR family winged helix-turn-helix transcriptional regulator [Actinomycetota bacterium]